MNLLLTTLVAATIAVDAPFGKFSVSEPTIPARDFVLTDYGAKPGVKCTDAFAAAIRAAHGAGGGRVVVPKGEWLTGAIRLKSGVELHLADGSTVVFTDDPADYPVVHTTWEGVECLNHSPLVYAYCCTNVAITGSGTFAPKMGLWRTWFERPPAHMRATECLYHWGSTNAVLSARDVTKIKGSNVRPHLLQINRSANVLLDGFRIRESPFWTIHLYHSENCIVRRLDVYAHGSNNDGVDVDMTKNVLVEKCRFDQGDDGIVLKAGRNQDAWRLNRPTENVVVRDCDFIFAHTLLGIGSELSGGVRNVWMTDCRIDSCLRLCYVKTNRRRGGFVENVWVDNVRNRHSSRAFISIETDILYQWADFPDYEQRYTRIRNINMSDIHGQDTGWMFEVKGDPHEPVEGLHFENLSVDSVRKGFSHIVNAKGVDMKNVTLGTGIVRREGEVARVDEFDLSGSSCGFGRRTTGACTIYWHALTVAGERCEHGFCTHPEGAVAFRANGLVKAFDARVGVDDESKTSVTNRLGNGYGGPAARFRVWADGKIAWSSDVIKLRQKAVPVHVELAGAKEIVLETTMGGAWLDYAAVSADWLDARFTCAAGAQIEAVKDPSLVRQLGILTPPEKPEPRINGADIWGVRPGHPVIFRVATSGVRPMTFSAKGLPAGVTLDAKGVLRGTAPATPGDYDIEVTAANAKGTATRTIRLAVGDTIGLTPPMGWNSWNTLCFRLTADKAKAAARAMEESGLGNHGWAYVNLDDWWEMNNSKTARIEDRRKYYGGREDVIGPARDADGKIVPNRSFPDMKGLTDYIHAFGFKAGLYSSPGPETCGGCEGSYGHEPQDAASWADWGFDYVKYDWCSYSKVCEELKDGDFWSKDKADWRKTRSPGKEKPYRLLNECLRRQKRDIFYSFCQYGTGQTELWARDAGANSWRCWDDLKDAWPWMESALEGRIGAENFWKYNGPGCWGDPDMMIIGQQYSFGYDHPSFLTPNEQYTHVSLWAMVGAPLLTGCDLTKLDAFTKNLLMNDEVIAVSQDRLGKTAQRIRHSDAESVWVRPVVGGAKAVALVNRSPIAREITVSFEELGLPARCWVKDLWRQKCEGQHAGTYVVNVPPHATKLVRMRPIDCPKCE